jgi:hypothetical protein
VINAKMVGILVAAFVAGSFVASPELRAYAANTVFSADIVDGEVKTADLAANAVTAAKIKDAEVKAAEIATDAVGAAEIQGVTKLLFAKCNFDSRAGSGGMPGTVVFIACNITGVDAGDNAVANLKGVENLCFVVKSATPESGKVTVGLVNVCSISSTLDTGDIISIIVYDK